MKRFTRLFLQFGVALTYLLGSYCFDEFHPFSHFYMYNSFPNWSYAFQLNDEKGRLIPAQNLNTDGIKLGYLYYSIAQHKQIPYGAGIESKWQLHQIGEQMTKEILAGTNPAFAAKNLTLVRTYYSFHKNQIRKQIDTLYEKGRK